MWFNKVEKVHNAGLRHWPYFFVYPRRAILKRFFFNAYLFNLYGPDSEDKDREVDNWKATGKAS